MADTNSRKLNDLFTLIDREYMKAKKEAAETNQMDSRSFQRIQKMYEEALTILAT